MVLVLFCIIRRGLITHTHLKTKVPELLFPTVLLYRGELRFASLSLNKCIPHTSKPISQLDCDFNCITNRGGKKWNSNDINFLNANTWTWILPERGKTHLTKIKLFPQKSQKMQKEKQSKMGSSMRFLLQSYTSWCPSHLFLKEEKTQSSGEEEKTGLTYFIAISSHCCYVLNSNSNGT